MHRFVLQNALVASLLSALPFILAQAPATPGTPARPAGPPQRTPIAQQLTFAPFHTSGIYKIGDTAGWTVTPGPVTPLYAYKYTVRRNNAVVLKEGRLDLADGKDTIEVSGDQPEMLYVAIEPYAVLASAGASGSTATATAAEAKTADAGPANSAARSVTDAAAGGAPPASPYTGGNTGRNNGLYALGAAVAPLQIPMSAPRPADFDTFWHGKLIEQAKVSINPILTPAASDVTDVNLSIFTLDALGSKTHGYIAKPAREGKFPALIQLQYAGVYALNARMDEQRAASGWLVINVDSHDKQPNDPSGGIPRGYQAVWGATRRSCQFWNTSSCFNPRSPCGERPSTGSMLWA